MSETTVTLRIAGDARGAVQATTQARDALGRFAGAASQASDATGKARDALGRFVAGARQAEQATEGLTRKLQAKRFELGGLQAALAGAGLVGFAVVVARASDAMAGLDARLKITARTTQDYATAQALVLRIAQETRQSLADTGALYVKLTGALKDTGASQLEVANLTRTINQAFAVSGASAAEAGAAITQLAQGLAAGALRGDEFNSVAEQAPRIMDALAKSLGVSRGELRAMAEDGKLTADVIRTALAGAAQEIDAEFQQLPATIGGGLQQIGNAFQFLVGYLDKETGTGSAIGRFLGQFADFVEAFPATLLGVFGQFETWWAQIKALFQAGGVALKAAIMDPINAVIRGLQLSLLQLAQAAAQLPGGLGEGLAVSLGQAIGKLNEFTFTGAEARAELRAIAEARDAEIAAIQRGVQAQQDDFTARRQAIASEQEYESRVRVTNTTRAEADRLSRQWAQAERQLAAQRLPLLEQFVAEVRARRELRAVLADADAALDNEIRMAGLSAEGRRQLANAIEAENFAREVNQRNIAAGRPLTEAEIAAIRANYEARLNLRDATEEATRAQEAANQATAQFADTYLSQATDAIGQFVASGMRNWRSLWDSFKDIGRRALAEFVSNLLRQRIVVPILAQITGQGGGVAGQAASALGGGGFGGLVGTAGTIASGVGAVAGALGFTGFAAGTGIMATAGIGAATQFGIASLAAGNLGVGFGALLGPIGLAVGALALLAGALKDTTRRITVIGSDLVGSPGYRNLAPDAIRDSALGGFAFASIDNVGREERDQLAGAIQQFDASIAALLSGEQLQRVKDAVSQINTQATEGAITAETFIQRRFDAVLSTMSESVQAFVREGGTLEEQMQRLGEALRRPAEIQAVLDSLERDDMLASMTELERQTFLVNEQFDQAIEYLTAREASEEQLARVEELRTAALGRLQEAQEGVLQAERDAEGIARMLSQLRFDESLVGLDDTQRALALLARELAEAEAAAIAMGATEAELAELREIYAARAERVERDAADRAAQEAADYWQRVQEENARAAEETARAIRDTFGGLADWLRGEAFGETSTLTPQERLVEAQAQFQDVLRRAASGDTSAAQGIQGAADRLLGEALSFFGGGDQFRALREAVLAAIRPLAALGTSGTSDPGAAQGALRQALALFQALTGGGVGPVPGAFGVTAANAAAFAGLPAAASVGGVFGAASAANDPASQVARLEARLAAVESAVRAAGDAQVSAINRLASSGARFG